MKRRLTISLLAGLSYLQRTVQIPIPDEVLGQLRAVASRARIEQLELRAQMKQPRQRRWYEQLLLYHEQELRCQLPLGGAAGIGRRLRLERRRLGLRTPLDLRYVRVGGRPGPGRPAAEYAAAVGTGSVDRPSVFDPSGTISFADPNVIRDHVVYGTWCQERHGCWIAGVEARLIAEIPDALRGRPALSISAETHLADQEMTVAINGTVASRLRLKRGAELRETVMLPDRGATADTGWLDIRLRCRHAASLATLGTGDDDRLFGVFLRKMSLVASEAYPIGRRLTLARGTDPAGASTQGGLFLSGWHLPEAEGRWTDGSVTRVHLQVVNRTKPVDLELVAWPYLGPRGAPLQFVIYAGRCRLARLKWGTPGRREARLPIPPRAFERDGGLTLTWRITNPRSPRSQGESADERVLGLMVESIALMERGAVSRL